MHNIFFSFFFSTLFIVFALLVLHPPSRGSDPGSHSRLFYPLPTTVCASRFYREKDSAVFFPRRLASNCAYPRCKWRSRQLFNAEIPTRDINSRGVRG